MFGFIFVFSHYLLLGITLAAGSSSILRFTYKVNEIGR